VKKLGLVAFKSNHPDVRLAPLATVVCTCQKKPAASFEDAYKHVYGDGNGDKGCSWCRERLEKDNHLRKIAAIKKNC